MVGEHHANVVLGLRQQAVVAAEIHVPDRRPAPPIPHIALRNQLEMVVVLLQSRIEEDVLAAAQRGQIPVRSRATEVADAPNGSGIGGSRANKGSERRQPSTM